jgi:hypothetical protein
MLWKWRDLPCWLAWLVRGLVFLLGYLLASSLLYIVFAHDKLITGCSKNIPIKSVTYLFELKLSNGMIAEFYDRNNDHKSDIIAYSLPAKKGHRQYPIYYEVDLDFDGLYDKLYTDKAGTGDCNAIIEIDDYDKPGDHWRPADFDRFRA